MNHTPSLVIGSDHISKISRVMSLLHVHQLIQSSKSFCRKPQRKATKLPRRRNPHEPRANKSVPVQIGSLSPRCHRIRSISLVVVRRKGVVLKYFASIRKLRIGDQKRQDQTQQFVGQTIDAAGLTHHHNHRFREQAAVSPAVWRATVGIEGRNRRRNTVGGIDLGKAGPSRQFIVAMRTPFYSLRNSLSRGTGIERPRLS